MYVKISPRKTFFRGELTDRWFRDDNETLVGELADTYYNIYYGRTQPIIKTPTGIYIKPFYGRILPYTKKFVPLCEGVNTHLCAGPICKEFLENPYICPRHKPDKSIGYYIWVD